MNDFYKVIYGFLPNISPVLLSFLVLVFSIIIWFLKIYFIYRIIYFFAFKRFLNDLYLKGLIDKDITDK